jgi:AraC-like DNA-binding protein
MWIGVFKPVAVRRVATDPKARVLREANPTGDYCRRLSQRNLDRLERTFTEIASALDRPGFFNAGLGYALAAAWQCFENSADVPVRDVHPAVEKAARLIRGETSSSSLEDLARRAGLSATRLSRLFKQQTGVALVDFRNRQRVERFLEIYGTGQRLTMLDAALEAGFGSYPQFHRVFKRVMGCAPGSYRSKQLNASE